MMTVAWSANVWRSTRPEGSRLPAEIAARRSVGAGETSVRVLRDCAMRVNDCTDFG